MAFETYHPSRGGEIATTGLKGRRHFQPPLSMGQSQSNFSSEDEGKKTSPPSTVTRNSSSSSSPPSMEDLIAEATAESGDENETLDQKAQRALECPCVADLRKGPCGSHFSEAFVCFIKSTAEEKGSDCVSPFIALQSCIRANPNAFSKDVLDTEDEEEDEVKEYKIRTPSWSKETAQSKI